MQGYSAREIGLELCEQFRPLAQILSDTLKQPENVQLPTGKAGTMANRHSSEGFCDCVLTSSMNAKTEAPGRGLRRFLGLGRRELTKAGGQRDWHPGFDVGAVGDVLGLLNPTVGMHARHQITTFIRDYDVDSGVGRSGQLGHPAA